MKNRRAGRACMTGGSSAGLLAAMLALSAACGVPTTGESQPWPEQAEPTDTTQDPALGEDAGTPTQPTPPPGGGEGADAGPVDCSATALEAQRILSTRCAGCHGNGNAMGGFATVLDPAALLSERRIIANDPQGSPLFRLVEAGAMPKGGPRLSTAELATLRAWISCGAPAPSGGGDPSAPPGDDAGVAVDGGAGDDGDDDDDDEDDDGDDDDDDEDEDDDGDDEDDDDG